MNELAAFDLDETALLVVDVQVGFDDPWWGTRNNPACDSNIERLVTEWTDRSRPVVYVRHDSTDPRSPLHPTSPGNELKPYLTATPDLRIAKSVNSAFHGTPDLRAWLDQAGIRGLVVCGITTNHCCETTARIGGNLGYDVLFALDATHTFDRTGPDGFSLEADELAAATAVNLHREFAHVTSTRDLVAASG
jgi:nicotinamidase-related amidase